MTYENFELSVTDGLARLVLNRPDVGNAFTERGCEEFGLVADELASRSDVRAVLLSARGRFFSVGGDLSMFTRDLDRSAEAVRRGTAGLHRGIARLRRLDAPLVACVHAPASGGAVAVISNCDFVYAARSAKLGAAYIHVGFTCDLGATVGLASRMGVNRAMRFLMLGETLTAEAAQKAGLVDEVFDDDAIAAESEALAQRLAQGPTQAYGQLRQLFSRVFANGFESQIEDEAQVLARIASSQDAREGLTAFAEKRKPRFKGR